MIRLVYTGYRTSRGGNTCFFNDTTKLKIGESYYVERYTVWESHNGNGGSSYSSPSDYYKVFKNSKLIEDRVNTSVFTKSLPKTCSHKNVIYAFTSGSKKRCDRCLKFLKVKRVVEAL